MIYGSDDVLEEKGAIDNHTDLDFDKSVKAYGSVAVPETNKVELQDFFLTRVPLFWQRHRNNDKQHHRF